MKIKTTSKLVGESCHVSCPDLAQRVMWAVGATKEADRKTMLNCHPYWPMNWKGLLFIYFLPKVLAHCSSQENKLERTWYLAVLTSLNLSIFMQSNHPTTHQVLFTVQGYLL